MYLSFWILLALPGAGAIALFWQSLPGYAAVLDSLILVAIVGGVLKESITKHPPHRFSASSRPMLT
jgi:divalent metal cation (Fe/Co/Zn/Cd) transporter